MAPNPSIRHHGGTPQGTGTGPGIPVFEEADMGSDPRVVRAALDRVAEGVKDLPGVSVERGDDVTKLVLGRGVIGRFHADGLVEIPFPRAVGDRLVAAGRAEHHHALPDSGWVDLRVTEVEDADSVLELLRLAYAARRPDAAGSAPELRPPMFSRARELQNVERKIDESVEESFPASDPPAPGRE